MATNCASWLKSVRALAHPTLALPIFFGGCVAWATGHRYSLPWLLCAHGFGVLMHVLTVWINDLSDEDTDAQQASGTLISGGSRVLTDGALSRRALGTASIVVLALITVLAGSATYCGRLWTPWLFLGAVVLLLGYSWPWPNPQSASDRRTAWRGLAHWGHGEWLQTLGVGCLLPCLGFYFQAGELSRFPWTICFPGALLAFASHVATAFPDAAADTRAGKRTVFVRYGSRNPVRGAIGAVILATLCVVGMIVARGSAGAFYPLFLLSGLLPLLWCRTARTPLQQSFAILAAVQSIWLGWCVILLAQSNLATKLL